MEIFDLYNKHNQKLNQTMVRGTSNQPGQYHKIVHVWIRQSNGDYLIQQRNKTTDLNPYQWAPTAGAVLSGEEPVDAVIRETKEEIGVLLDKDEINLINRYFVDYERANFIIELYLVQKDITLDQIRIDKDEVKDVMIASYKTIMKLMDDEMFWDFSFIDPNYLNELEGCCV